MHEQIDHYLTLIERVFHNATQANIDRVEAYERAHPWVVDAAYRRGLEKSTDRTVRVNS
ncbi:MAG: hypothetical protein ACYSWO_26570 [Planctomycetota bacterium]|jgi:hypothetical protein